MQGSIRTQGREQAEIQANQMWFTHFMYGKKKNTSPHEWIHYGARFRQVNMAQQQSLGKICTRTLVYCVKWWQCGILTEPGVLIYLIRMWNKITKTRVNCIPKCCWKIHLVCWEKVAETRSRDLFLGPRIDRVHLSAMPSSKSEFNKFFSSLESFHAGSPLHPGCRFGSNSPEFSPSNTRVFSHHTALFDSESS